MTYKNQTEQDIDNIAKEIAKNIKGNELFLLYGNLGSGKTFFTNKLCKHLGLESLVNSPSYILLNEYSGDTQVLHYDLYRLSSSIDAIELGILDRLSEGITIIEWPELIREYITRECIEIHFSHAGENRDLEIKYIN